MDYIFWFRKRFPQLLFEREAVQLAPICFQFSGFSFQSLFARESVLNQGCNQRDYA
jgi:hypothetical protein